MKNQTLILAALAGVALYMVATAKKSGRPTLIGNYNATEVTNPNGSGFDNGWRYFSDGTSIDPDGNYYSAGQLVYRAQ